MLAKFFGFFIVLALGGASACAQTKQLTVAVASNFTDVATQIGAEFTTQHAIPVRLVNGSSGMLYAQIRQGAPYDVFLSADYEKPRLLVQNGLAINESLIVYAIGAIALWSANKDIPNLSSSTLSDARFNRLALANPEVAPYGTAALQTLTSLGVEKITSKRWVMGENIAQTFQFVMSGNAALGFVAVPQLIQYYGKVPESAWIVPSSGYHADIQQAGAILTTTKAFAEADLFMRFLQTKRIRGLLIDSGYRVPIE